MIHPRMDESLTIIELLYISHWSFLI